jgi:hypothetical protein
VNNTIKLTFVTLMLTSAAGCNANLAPLPVASAVIVHACGVAEAEAYMRNAVAEAARAAAGKPDDADKAEKAALANSLVGKTTIHVETAGEIDGSGKIAAGDSTAASAEVNATASKKTAKWIEVEINQLPPLQACIAWGYKVQLAPKGCVLWNGKTGDPSFHCRNEAPGFTTPNIPSAPPAPSK